MEYQKRKCDRETESMRIWISDKDKHPEEFEESMELKDEGITVPYKEAEFKLLGFNKAFDPKTNELKFAWKFKHEEHLVLVYNPSKEDEDIINPLFDMMKMLGYEIQNVEETLKKAYNEIPQEMKEKMKEKK